MSRGDKCSKCKSKGFYRCDCGCNEIIRCECNNVCVTIGFPGPPGNTGATGLLGATGLQGFSSIGYNGATGSVGATGLIGATGINGNNGSTGICCPGSTGLQGFTGLQGLTGATGFGIGILGATGLMGSNGPMGGCCPGPTGFVGFQGPTGFQGATGVNIGYQGASGIDGLMGATGPCCVAATGFVGASGMVPGIYGSAYSNLGNNQTLNGTTGLNIINFSSTGPLPVDPADQIILVNNNALQVPVTGNYEADYTVLVSTLGYNPFLLIKNYSIGIPNSIFTSGGNEIVGNVQFSATAGDQISLASAGETVQLLTNKLSIVSHTITFASGGITSIISVQNPAFNGLSNSLYVFLQLTGNRFLQPIPMIADSLGRFYTLITDSTRLPFGSVFVYYLDNAISLSNFTVTATFTTAADAIIEVIEIINASTPSLVSSGLANFPTLPLTLNPTAVGQLMLMGVVSIISAGASGQYTNSTTMTILDTTMIANDILTGADAFSYAGTTGPQIVTVNYTPDTGQPNISGYNAVGVVIGVGNYPVSINNASLAIEYLD